MSLELAEIRPQSAGSVHLLGGGWDPTARSAMYGPFLDRAGAAPVIACLVLDEGDGQQQFERWAEVLRRTATCEPVPVLVREGEVLDPQALGDAAGLLVCGGLTPAYADSVVPVAGEVRAWLADGGRPYAGFSAGAALAARHAVVGGWLVNGVPVCPEEAGEDLEEVTVRDGLALVDAVVDVHGAQWRTFPRLVAALAGTSWTGLCLDENTAVHVESDGVRIAGLGEVRRVRGGESEGQRLSAAATPARRRRRE